MSCKVIAHRGANTKAPQNTLPAFRAAIADGADGFETDVHLTSDGKLVICHNYTIDDTSDGRGEVSSYTLDELRKFDFGSYFGEEFAGTSIPTLEEFIETVKYSPAEIINIELKCPKDHNMDIVRMTVDMVKRHGVLNRVIISSFSPSILSAAKLSDNRCKTAFLYPTNHATVCRPVFNPFLIAKRVKCDILHPASFTVTKPLVALAHKNGMDVNVWTVNEARSVLRLLNCGVDGLITDCPEKVLNIVSQYESKNSNKNGEGAKVICTAKN